jgi:hypothetical protein
MEGVDELEKIEEEKKVAIRKIIICQYLRID